LTLPRDLELFNGKIKTFVFTRESPCQPNALTEYISLDFNKDILPQIMEVLYQKKIQSLLVEGGSILLQSFIDSGLWDEAFIEKALQVAERNCRRNGVRVTLEQRDVLLASPAGERFDVIVSNPPYITEKEREDMSANVLEWEPELALFVPDDSPLLFYRKIAELGRDMLVSGGRLYFEINQEYGRETVDMLAGLEYKNIELRKDLFQNDRMIKAEK
jgi:hypothetical protein